mgnify:CR=1 FL=1
MSLCLFVCFFFFQAEDGIRDLVRSRGLGDVYKRQVFILTIPFFLKKFGIKKVMLFSMLAWVLRFGLFGFGNPADGLWMIILSCIVYGMAVSYTHLTLPTSDLV